MNPDLAIYVFFGFFVVVILMSTVYFFADLKVKRIIRIQNHEANLKDRAAHRHIEMTRLFPNDQGDYPVFFRDDTLEFIAPSPGNGNRQPHIYFQPGTMPGKERTYEIKPPTPREIRINAYAERQIQGEVESERLPEPERSEELPEPSNERRFEPTNGANDDIRERSELDIRAILYEAKRRGEGKQKTIAANTGAKPGNNRQWNYWSMIWDEFPT